MALTALVDDRLVFIPDLPQPVVDDVRANRRSLTLRCCKQPGHLRHSRRGLLHAYHTQKAGCSSSKGESWQHELLKLQARDAARRAGWDAEVEVYRSDVIETADDAGAGGPDWIADVLCIDPTDTTRRVALEIQWSTQTGSETRMRQDRYQTDGVTAVWFFRRMPKDLATDVKLPALTVGEVAGEFKVDTLHRQIAFTRIVELLMFRDLRFRRFTTRTPTITIEFSLGRVRCHGCGNDATAFVSNAIEDGGGGRFAQEHADRWSGMAADLLRASDPSICLWQPVQVNRWVTERWCRCPWCRRRDFRATDVMDAIADGHGMGEVFFRVDVPSAEVVVEAPHWCTQPSRCPRTLEFRPEPRWDLATVSIARGS